MVNYQADLLSRTFAAISDPTRREMLARLRSGELRVSELARPFRISLPAVSRHIGVLESAGLLTKRREGREQYCSLLPGPLGDAAIWLSQYRAFWESQLDNFAAFVESQHQMGEKSWRTRKRNPRSASAGSLKRRGRKSSRHGRSRRK